jgi:hypothetical protein
MADNLDDIGGAFERAAIQTSRGVRPRYLTRTGREEGAATRTLEQIGEDYLLPKTPLDYGLLALGVPGRLLGVGGKALALGLGGLLSSTDEAEAGPTSAVLRIGRRAPKGGGLYPGIFKNPKEIATEAEARVASEHPALKELFGVTRGDLYDISEQGRRAGNIDPLTLLRLKANPRGSYLGEGVATEANAQRLIDALSEAGRRAPGLVRGMDPWFVMDPAYQRMVQLVGPEQAARDYARFNTLGAMASPGTKVIDEINRGTAANMMAHQGQFPLFQRYGGVAEKARPAMADFPPQLLDVIGHPYHPTAQAGPMGRYLASGAVDMTSPKVPLYIGASGVPEVGFQTALPIADAHFTRAVGAADVRGAAGVKKPGVSLKTPEYMSVGPWFAQNVARPLGIEAVPAQARLWGLMSQYTGVDTPIGAPKLELLAQRIWERAKEKGIDPRVMRDYVLRGAGHAAMAGPIAAGALQLGGGEQ